MEALRDIVDELMTALSPVIDAAQEPAELQALLANLGWTPNSAPQPLRDLVSAGADLVQAIGTDGNFETSKAIDAVKRLTEAINAITNNPDNAFPAGVDVATFKATIARDLLDYILVSYLLRHQTRIGAVLKLAGLIRLVETPAAGARQTHLHHLVAWNTLGKLFTDPAAGFRDVFDWTGAKPRLADAIADLAGLLESYGLTLEAFEPTPQLLAFVNMGAAAPLADDALGVALAFDATLTDGLDLEAGIQMLVFPATAARGPAIGLLPYARIQADTDIPLSDTLSLKVGGSADFSRGIAFIVASGAAPEAKADFLGGVTAIPPELKLGLRLKPVPGEPERVLLGAADASRLAINTIAFNVGARLVTATDLDVFVEAQLDGGRIVVKPAPDESDSFLATMLGSEGISADFSFGVRLSSRSGFGFTGAGGLEMSFPLHVALGPIEFQGLTLGLKPRGGDFDIEVGATVAGKLGPLAFVIERAGFKLIADFPDPPKDNLGPIDVSVGFKPPNGVGLSIDAGAVKGGGYLFFDFDREEYAGALELTIADFLSLKAIGLVTTRMPDGSRGFSLLIIITAEFSPGVQLGYGFVLIGVGGLLGLNRSVVLEALALGVRTGAVNGILFPVDIVANAPRILSDLRTIFPATAGRFLIGPMAKLGWGAGIVTLELGIIIEIPGNVAILGVLRLSIAGDDGASVLQLQVNFIGAIEFDKKRGWFFAALFESRLLTIAIEGEMGLLIAVGDQPNFLISVGGFHPQFTIPPLPFPSPRRIALNIIDTDYARIRAETYFAVTTNTVQMGVRAELFFGFSAFSVDGSFQFDALIRFKPPYLLVEVSARASLKVGGVGVFGIDLEFTLTGPGPWRARGSGSVSLLFFAIHKSFDETWGQTITTSLPPISIVPLLLEEVAKTSSWRALPPPEHNLLVSLRRLELPADALVLHPLGTLEISQNALPLGITLDRVGEQIPADANRLALNVTAGPLTKRRDASRSFAPAQFRNMSDAQKLSAPAFQDQPSGLELGVSGNELRTGHALKRSMRYELTTIDTLWRRSVQRFKDLGVSLFQHLLKNAPVAKSALSRARKRQLQPFADGVALGGDRYAVVSIDTNRSAEGTVDFASEAEAREWLRQRAARDPNERSKLHVVPSTERNAA
jgi:hypothetical protein